MEVLRMVDELNREHPVKGKWFVDVNNEEKVWCDASNLSLQGRSGYKWRDS